MVLMELTLLQNDDNILQDCIGHRYVADDINPVLDHAFEIDLNVSTSVERQANRQQNPLQNTLNLQFTNSAFSSRETEIKR